MGIDQVTLAELRSRYGAREARLAEAAIDVIAGAEGLEAVTAHRLQEFLWRTLPGWRIDDPERVAAALGHLFTLTGLDRYAELATCEQTESILEVYAGEGIDAGREACDAAIAESGLLPPDTTLLAWRVFSGPEEHAARHACAATLELALIAGELRPGARGWERTRAAVTERCLTAPRPGGTLLDRVRAERLTAWAQPVNPDKAALLGAAVHLLREPVPPTPAALAPLRWLLGEAREGLPLTERHHIAPNLVATAVDAFGWRTPAGRHREPDVAPLHNLRMLAAKELKAIRRIGRRLVLTPVGRRMAADERVFWDGAVRAVIGEGPVFALAVREVMLALLLLHGPLTANRLERRTIDILDAEWEGDDRLPAVVREQRLLLRDRLWALGCHRPGGRGDEPFTLTPWGVTAVRAALRAHALRPHPRLPR